MIKAISGVLLLVLEFLYRVTGSYGLAIVLFAIIIKILLLPLTQRQFKAMKEMQLIQPELKKIQTKYKDDPQQMQKEVMALYRTYRVNPLSGCLPLIIQMPILIALYQTITADLEKFVGAAFLWIGPFAWKMAEWFPGVCRFLEQHRRPWQCEITVDFHHKFPMIGSSLAEPDMLLLLLYGISMYLSSKLTTVDPSAAQTQRMMNLMMPVMLVMVFQGFSSAFILYWFIFNLLSIAHQYVFMRAPAALPPPPSAEGPEAITGRKRRSRRRRKREVIGDERGGTDRQDSERSH